MASFPQGGYGSMPMFYPTGYPPGYQYQAFPTSWPPAQVHMAGNMPPVQPVVPQVHPNARGPAPMVLQQMPLTVPYGYGPAPSQDQQQQQQQDANEQEPDLEEARNTMLAQYYKNPYYGLKAQLARAKADKKQAASKAKDDMKSLIRYKQYLEDAKRDYIKDKTALSKRERYWSRVAQKEGIDEATITNEQKALAARKRQLLDTRDYLVQQRGTLREQLRTAGVPVKDDESDLSGSSSSTGSSSSSSSSSRSHRRKHSRERRRHKTKRRRKRSRSRGARDRSTRHPDREHTSLQAVRASPPLFPMDQTRQPLQERAVPLSSAALAALPKLSDQHNRISEHLATQQQVKEVVPPLQSQPLRAEQTTASEPQPVAAMPLSIGTAHPEGTGFHVSRPSSQKAPPGQALRSLSTAEGAQSLSLEQPEIPIMQIKFPRKQSFFLSASQISVDAPNAFTQVLRDSQHKLKPGKTLKVPIQDHIAPVFTIIHAYLSGRAILPLSIQHKEVLGAEQSEAQAYELLLRDARFYQLKSLQRALEDQITSLAATRAVQEPGNPTVATAMTPPPPPFVLINMVRKGQTIDIKDLNHLSVAKLSGRRLRRTLPQVRALISGAALNFGAKSVNEGILQYSLVIPSTPLSSAWRMLSSRQSESGDEVYFIEGEISLKEAATIKLNVDYTDRASQTKRRSSGLDEIYTKLSSVKPAWDKVLSDSFRFLQIGSPPDATTSRSTTPVFGIAAPASQRNLVNIPIASLIIDFTAAKDQYRVDIRQISTKTRELEAHDGYDEFAEIASLASR